MKTEASSPDEYVSLLPEERKAPVQKLREIMQHNLPDGYEETKHSKTKLDMGKSCIRFKKPGQIPYELIGELVQKISPQKWIKMYGENLRH